MTCIARRILLFASLSTFGMPEKVGLEKYLEILDKVGIKKPVKIQKASLYSWIEFCPDNICEVVRTRSENSDEGLAILAVGYFLYASKYSYLQDLQNNQQIKREFIQQIRRYPIKQCNDSEQKEFVLCALRKISIDIGGELIFVRFDENKIASQKLNLIQELVAQFKDSTKVQ